MGPGKKLLSLKILGIVLVCFLIVWMLLRIPGVNRRASTMAAAVSNFFNKTHPDITFKDVTQQSGIHFRQFYGKRTNQLPEDMGSGAAWFDYDQDGWQDLFLVNEIGPVTMTPDQIRKSPGVCALYHNNGNGTFTNVTKQSGINFRGWGMGVATGDYNNDGWPDIFISAYGHNVLYRNNGNGTFTDVTKQAGLYNYKGFWSDARWGDFDDDGYLDLYVTGYVIYKPYPPQSSGRREGFMIPKNISPAPFGIQPNLLFHNLGNGKFKEMAAEAGVANPRGRSLSASWCDINDDGWPDLIVANDYSQNKIYLNMHNMHFVDISYSSLFVDFRNSMGIAIGDWDLDGDMDIFLTNWLNETNTLYVNLRNLMPDGRSIRFIEEADSLGLGKPSLNMVGWGTSFIDFDNDTRPDLFVANGSTNPEPDNESKLIPMHSQLFWNKSNTAGFYDVTRYCGKALMEKHVSRGAAFADYDNDGDVDILIMNHGEAPELLRNDGGNKNNWIEISLTGTLSNRSAIGAKLRLYVGGKLLIREVGSQSSYQCQNSLVQHFGLNRYNHIDSLVVRWPHGEKQTFTHLPINHIIDITEQNPHYRVFNGHARSIKK